MQKSDSGIVGALMTRFIYLNQLRVGITKYFLAVVAAVVAAVTFATSTGGIGNEAAVVLADALPYAILLLLLVGLIVYVFDYRCRALASKAAKVIRDIVEADKRIDYKNFPFSDRFGEDFAFSSIVMLVNSCLLWAFLGAVFRGGADLRAWVVWWTICPALLLFVFQITRYAVKWPKLAHDWDEWPR